MIQKAPIYIDLDRRREIIFNINTEILIRNSAGNGSIFETVGERENEAGEKERIINVNLENLRTYLWASLQEDARRRGETLTVEDVGRLITRQKQATQAASRMVIAIAAYYGDEPGEAEALPA